MAVIAEAEFLRRLCDSSAEPIRRLHTLEQFSQLLGISGLRLRRWIELGLIQAYDPMAIAPMFDYQEVAAAKSLSRLIARGVSPINLADMLDEAGSEPEALLLWLRIARYPAAESNELIRYASERCSTLAH